MDMQWSILIKIFGRGEEGMLWNLLRFYVKNLEGEEEVFHDFRFIPDMSEGVLQSGPLISKKTFLNKGKC